MGESDSEESPKEIEVDEEGHHALDYETHMPNIFHDQACRIEGYINVARVPGNFHVEARSQTEDLSPAMANLSHIVHHLQFGNTLVPALEKKLPTRQQFMIHP